MKKALVVFLLAIFMATGAFAQTTVTGQAQVHFGLNMPMNDPFSMDDANWVFNILNSQTFLRINRVSENTSGQLTWRADGVWRGWGRAGVADTVCLEIGHIELPWVQWSGFWLFAQNNFGAGAAASTVNPYFLFRTMGFYAGITEAGILQGATASRYTPGFFVGYALPLDMMNLHFAFAGRAAEDVFSFMGTAQARAIDLGFASLGVNATVYMNPEFGFFVVSGGGPFAALARRASDENIFVLECLLDLRVPLATGSVHFSLGGVTNFGEGQDGFGLQAGFMWNLPLQGGFSIMPGIQYRTFIGNDARDTLLIGANLRYSF